MDGFSVKLTEDAINLREYATKAKELAHCGGVVQFEGVIRDHNHGKQVNFLEYSSYESMAEKELRKICIAALENFGIAHVDVVHRLGKLEIGDVAVVIRVLSPHRAEAFNACKFVIDTLKNDVPIWKKEHYQDGTTDWPICNHGV